MAVATTTTTTAAAAATATTTSANQRRNIVQSDVNDDNDCCGSCPVQSTSSLSSSSSRAPSTTSTSDRTTNTTVNSLRIVTWSNGPAEVTLRAYAELYRTMYPTAPIIQIYTIPSLRQLDMEVTNDLKTQSRLYDGFVIPPILLGNMIEQDNGLVPWEDKEDEMDHSETTTNTTRTTTTTNSPLHDLLPYYKYSVATFGGPDTVLAVPLFGGSQQLVLYRKDYFDRLDMSVTPPKTWSDYVRIASELHDTPLGPGGSKIYGSCLGRLSFEKCRQQQQQQVGNWTSASATATATTTSTPLSWCNSQSMDYIGMMLSSMTQSDGNFTGWMMGVNSTSPSGLQPLFLPPIERILVLMEQQIKYGAPNELLEDATMNLRLFEQGLCGMTITSDHSMELLSQDNVGFGPLPGSHQVLDRSTTTTKNNNGSFIGCTESVCPYGVQYDEWGTVNMVPFGNTDIPMGAVSAFISQARQDATKRFFHFVMASSSSSIDASVNNNDTRTTPTRTRGQPMTYSELNQTMIRGYKKLLTSITSSENGASSFRIPNALNLYTELDNMVYDYLVSGNYTEFHRTKVASTVETTWQYMIQMHDSQGQSANPTSVFYEQSLGRYVPENITPPPPSDGNLYIGDVARIIGWSLGGLSCLASVLLALWVWKYQNETVVRASQPMFLWMVCAGTLIMVSSIFPFGIEDDIASYQASSIGCMAGPWLFCIGFVATFSALFSKIWLISRIFREARNQERILLTSKDMLLPFLILFGVNVTVLLVWTLVDPQEWVRIPINGSSSSSSSSSASSLSSSFFGDDDDPTAGWCYSDNTRLFLGIILGTNFVMMMVALIQAYECRRITTEYSESLWISGSIACIAQIWIVGLPILRLVEGNPQAVFLTKVGVIFGSSILTLALMFGPKFSYLQDSLDLQQQTARIKNARQQKHQQQKQGTTGTSKGRELGGHSRHFGQSSHHRQQQFSDTDSNSDEDFDHRSWAKSLVMPNPGPTGVDDDEDDHDAAVKGSKKAAAGGGPHAPSATTTRKRGDPEGALGIRVIPITVLNSNEVERIQIAVDKAESRNKQLQNSLEKLQERFELYVIARDPMGSNNNNNINTSFGGTTTAPGGATNTPPLPTAPATRKIGSNSTTTTVGPSYLVHQTSDHHRFAATGGGPNHWNNRVGRNSSILAARPDGLSGHAGTLLDADHSMPFQK